MELVKKNLVSIICGSVALLALVFVFYPMGGFYGDLQAKLDASQTMHNQVKSLSQQRHSLPPFQPEETSGQPLEMFPNAKAIKAGEDAVAKLHEQSALILTQAMKMNKRAPLVPAALAARPGATASAQFKNLYHQSIEQFKKAMNATTPPTQLDIQNEEARLLNEDYAKRIHRVGGQDLNSSAVMAEFNQRKAELPETLKRDRAKQFTMYISSEKTLDVHPPIPRPQMGGFPDILDIWAAQMGLWTADDVVRAIAETNAQAGAKDVETAAVKRLVKLEIPKRYITSQGELPFANEGSQSGASPMFSMGAPGMPGGPGAGAGMAVAALPEIDGVPKEFKMSPTGRVCNKLYDVTHFTVVVDTDAAKFRDFIANLEKNRFITVIRIDMAAVDRDKEYQRGFVYGAKPVVRLSLRCEAVFFRSWTKDLMPQNVRTLLNIPADEPAPVAVGQ